MEETDTDKPVKMKRFSESDYSSIRGAFTYTLLMLQERLSHIPEAEQQIVEPVVQKLDWNPESSFWFGSIVSNDGTQPSGSAYAPYIATSRIVLNINAHWDALGLDPDVPQKLPLSLSDLHEVSKLYYSPASVGLTSKEQNLIREKLFGVSLIRTSDTTAQWVKPFESIRVL